MSDDIKTTATKVRKKPVEWKHLRPKTEATEFRHYKYEQPDKVYTWRDGAGLVGYTCRFEHGEGDKDVIPYIYASKPDKPPMWVYNGFTERPLYNADKIVADPLLPVVLCEGEKVADWLNERSGDKFIATTWVGGSGHVQKTKFDLLNDRKVLICRDNDDPGLKCMQYVVSNCQPEVVYWAEIPEGSPKGWDMADSELNTQQVQSYIRRNLRAPVIKKHDQDETHFTYMGFEKSDNQPVFIFYAKASKTIFRLTTANMTKSSLMAMAPLFWWEQKFDGDLNAKALANAANTLIYTSYKVGIYSPKKVRGRGAWFDDGRVVIHAGDKLIVDGEEAELGELDTNNIYEIGESFNFNTANPVGTDQAKKLLKIAGLLNWERGVNAQLLAGWCVIAPVCGALKWRPHIWLTGGAGVGKSFVFTSIVRACLGETCLDVQGATTEAGLRQTLGFDAMPVVFDEIDGNTTKAVNRIEETIELARSASADDTGKIIKGSASHNAKAFLIRSCFAFSSILIGADKSSDRRRITTLALVKMPSEQKDQMNARWEELKKLHHETINDRFVAGLHARTIKLLPIILENSRTFTSAIVEVLGVQALGDQLGPMLAGAYSLQKDTLINYKDAVAYIKAQDWSEERETETLRDEVELLKNLMDWIVKVDGFGERSIGELLLQIAEPDPAAFMNNDDAKARLRRSGMRLDGDTLLISNTNTEIADRLSKTRWSRNYNKILMRLPGAIADNQRIMSKPERCVRLPLDLIK